MNRHKRDGRPERDDDHTASDGPDVQHDNEQHTGNRTVGDGSKESASRTDGLAAENSRARIPDTGGTRSNASAESQVAGCPGSDVSPGDRPDADAPAGPGRGVTRPDLAAAADDGSALRGLAACSAADAGRRPHDAGTREPDNDGGDVDGTDGLSVDEAALRAMLRQAVQEIGPGEGALDHLRRTVPVRRARKRQILVGAAATAVLLGTAVPAALHVSSAGNSSNDRTSVAGHGEATPGDSHESPGDGAATPGGPPAGGDRSHEKDSEPDTGSDPEYGSGGATQGPGPSRTLAASSPGCVADELGDAVANVSSPDSDGKVYGTFSVSNISDSSCTIDGAGSVITVAKGAADPARINVVDHTVGDAARRLPDPSLETPTLVLEPGRAYQVKFAWVPSESCSAGGGGASPDPTSSDGTGGSSSDQESMGSQLYREDELAEGSVLVSHTAEPGAPAADTTIPNACAGTLYHTGVLPTS